jgi:hypothetical protein
MQGYIAASEAALAVKNAPRAAAAVQVDNIVVSACSQDVRTLAGILRAITPKLRWQRQWQRKWQRQWQRQWRWGR